MATKRQAKAKPEKTEFIAKQWKLMVGDLEKVDYQNLMDSAVQQLQSGLCLEHYKSRCEFVRVIHEAQGQLRRH